MGSELKKACNIFCGDVNVLILIWALVTWVFQFVKIHWSHMHTHTHTHIYMGMCVCSFCIYIILQYFKKLENIQKNK